MKATLLLALVAVANASYFDEGWMRYDDLAHISPMLTRAMFLKFGFAKPEFDGNFISFARSMGASDPTIGHMHALYDEPSVLFFMDPTGGIVSYYADSGVDNAFLSPELRSVFSSVLGAADSMAIAYRPESILGSYRSVLPGHFFMPSQSPMLAKFMRAGIDAFPLPVEHAIFHKSDIADIFPDVSPLHARFDIDEFPFAFKSPVALSHFNTDYSVGLPFSGLFDRSAFPGYGDSQFHPMFTKTSYPQSGGAFSPSYFRLIYPHIRSEFPAYRSGFIPTLKFPLAKHYDLYEPLVYSKPSFKILPYQFHTASAAPIASTPIAATPVVEPASPVATEPRGFPVYLRGFPSYYPNISPFRFQAPFYSSPIVPAASGIAGDSSSSMASASPMAGTRLHSAPLF